MKKLLDILSGEKQDKNHIKTALPNRSPEVQGRKTKEIGDLIIQSLYSDEFQRTHMTFIQEDQQR